MNRLALWLDNPILIKHVRSRLRRMQLISSVAVVVIIALCIVMLGYSYDKLSGGGAFGGLMALQSIILGVVGASQVASSVSRARESGIFEFHRASPMPAPAVTLGFFFGAPIREYALFAVTLPFSLICVAMGRPSPIGFVQLMVPLVLTAWALHALALFNSLVWKPSKSGARGLIGVILFVVFFSGSMFTGFSRAAALIDESPTLGFFWFQLPWLVVLALDLFPAIGFLLTAASRKIASERAPALTKPQAIACLVTGQFLLVGTLWNVGWFGYYALGVLYSTMAAAFVLTLTITPNLGEYTKGVRKAVRAGRSHPSPWSDRGLNRLALVCLCASVLVGPTVAWQVIEKPAPWASQMGEVSYSLPIAIGVFVVAYFGLALQYFQIRFGKRASIFMALFLFAAWILPLLVGSIAAAGAARSGGSAVVGEILASLSPIAGIALSAGFANTATDAHQAVQAAALVPAIVFAFLFNNLVVSARRRIDAEVHPVASGPAPDPLRDPEPKPEGLPEIAEPLVL